MNEAFILIGNVVVIYTFLASLAFCISYQLFAQWSKTSFGRSLMLYQVAMTIILGLITFRIIFSLDGVVFAVMRLVVFAVVPLALTWRLAVLIRLQWRGRRRKEDQV